MRFRPPQPVSMELNLAPMVDVMMCLIIFFLLASRLVDAQHRPLELAFAQAAHELDRNDLGTRVVINVRSLEAPVPGSGAPSLAQAEYVINGWDGRNITERVLTSRELEEYLKARAEQAAEHGEDLRCVIRAERHVPYRQVEGVLRGCGLAKISKIIFSTNTGEDPNERGETLRDNALPGGGLNGNGMRDTGPGREGRP